MNIEHMQEFIELSRRLNFTLTAKALHMTQPALSNHVHSLEQETGVTLIERFAKDHARLTPAGQLFLDMATKMTALYETTLPRLRDLQNGTTGKINIRSPRNEYAAPLLDYVFEFRRNHPEIDIVIWPWNDVDGIEDVVCGAVDCAYIGYVDGTEDSFAERSGIDLVPYATNELYLWADRQHPLMTGCELGVESLNGCQILIPANKKHDSWHAGISSVIARYKLDCRIVEKYCDSLEDLVMTKADSSDVMLCDQNLLTSSAFRLRDDRIARRFAPSVRVPISIGCAAEMNNRALETFIEFLRAKYHAETGTCD